MAVLAAGLFALWWRQQSNNAACRLNQRNVQQAVRSWSGMKGIGTDGSTPLDRSAIIGPGRFMATEPRCPCGGTYIWSPIHPVMGVLVIECRHRRRDPAEIKYW